MRVIYIDVLFINNLVINAFLLTVSALVSGIPIKPLRAAAGAAFGALYGVCALLPEMGFFAFFPLKAAVSFVMVGLACNCWEWLKIIKRTGMFFLCSFVLAGVLLCICAAKNTQCSYINGALYYNIPYLTVILSMLTAMLVIFSSVRSAVQRYRMGDFYKKVCITCSGKSIDITGFTDSGNCLVEPMTGLPVCVICQKSAEKLLGRKGINEICRFEAGELKTYPVFCSGVCGKSMLPAFIPDSITVNGERIRAMVAISGELCDSRYDILLNCGTGILEEEKIYDFRAAEKALH